MVDLKKKYQNAIAEMMKDAQANLAEAEKSVKERTEELHECENAVKELKNTANTAHKAFFDVIKNLSKLAFMKNPSPEELSKTLEPCNTYVVAAGQLPMALEQEKEADAELAKANEKLDSANDDLKNVAAFFS